MGEATKFFRFCRIYRGNPSRARFVVILRSIATKDLLFILTADSWLLFPVSCRLTSSPISPFTGPVSFAGPVEPSQHCVSCQLNPPAPSYNTKLY